MSNRVHQFKLFMNIKHLEDNPWGNHFLSLGVCLGLIVTDEQGRWTQLITAKNEI